MTAKRQRNMTVEEVHRLPAAVTMRQVSRALGISLDALYPQVQAGAIPGVIKIGRRYMMPKQTLLKMLDLAEPAAGVAS